MEKRDPSRPEQIQNIKEKNAKTSSEENPLVARMDEADPLNDRTPAGDMGPEDNENKKGFTENEASY